MTLAKVRSLAQEYARQYNPNNIAPFPYHKIVEERKDLEVFFTDLDEENISGATLCRNKRFTVLINTAKSETRQHFTLGHELGHYFLHQDVLQQEKGIVDGDGTLDATSAMLYRLDNAEHDKIEREANHFAASLLMPAHLVRRAWKVTESIEECAAIFQVSVVAMSIRLTQLGLVN